MTNVHHTIARRAISPVHGHPARQVPLGDLDEHEDEDDDDEDGPDRLLRQAEPVQDACGTGSVAGRSSGLLLAPSAVVLEIVVRLARARSCCSGPLAVTRSSLVRHRAARRRHGSLTGTSRTTCRCRGAPGRCPRRDRAGTGQRSCYSAIDRMASSTSTCSGVKFSRRYGSALVRNASRSTSSTISMVPSARHSSRIAFSANSTTHAGSCDHGLLDRGAEGRLLLGAQRLPHGLVDDHAGSSSAGGSTG